MPDEAVDGEGGSDQDEVRRKLLKPKVSAEEALSLLVDLYDADGGADADATTKVPRAEVVRELDSYDDVNYLVKVDGEKALLKIHNGVESDEYLAARSRKRPRTDAPRDYGGPAGTSIIDLHTAIFRHLAKPECGVTAGKSIPPAKSASAGGDRGQDDAVCVREFPVVSPEHGPRHLVVRLQSWVHGTPLSDVKRCPLETLVDAGRCLGRTCRALDDLAASDPDALRVAQRYHAWDGRHLADVRPYISHIDDPDRRTLVTGVMDAFEKTILEGKEGEKFRMGINHGDFNDANIIVDDAMQVSGCIDFGDTVYSWRVLDVSVAMAYGLISSYGKGNRSISAACAILRGFHHIYPLTPDERKHLRLLLACRLVTSVTFGNYTYKQNPENEYILFHAKPAWEALYFIWGMDGQGANGNTARVIDDVFKTACDNIDAPAQSSIPQCIDLSFPDPSIVDPFASARNKDDISQSKAQNSGKPNVTFVTGNTKKLQEVIRILFDSGDLPITLTNRKIDLPELQGDPTYVAKEKCAMAVKELKGPCIIEDTSLCFSALNGMPGVYIKWFLDKLGLDRLNDMISFSEDKSGYAQTVVAFSEGPGKEILTFEGRTEGKIVRPRGNRDFGWDPIFEPVDGGKELTYAEMTGEQKDSISHRKRAFAKLRDYLKQK
ncbi:hypothetical protein ACHAWF_015072 [Thalassiosira exigua]